MKKTLLLLPMLLMLLLVGCAEEEAPQTAQLFAMDTVMDFTVYGGSEAAAAIEDMTAEIQRLDTLLSRQNEDSAISALNRSNGAPVAVEEEVSALLSQAVTYTRETDGDFDITIAPIMDAWNFLGEHPRVPSQEELTALLANVGTDKLTFHNDGSVSLPQGCAVDLGGIAKGYASDRMAAVLDEDKIDSAMVSLGGNVYVRGSKPDGAPWRIAVEDPSDTAAYVGVLSLQDKYIITSGSYQRFFEQDGITYYHILNPHTGDVARSGLLSATVVGDNGTMGDALSTALFVMGTEDAIAFWRSYDTPFEMILVTDDGRVLVSDGLSALFDSSIAEHPYEYETISKN